MVGRVARRLRAGITRLVGRYGAFGPGARVGPGTRISNRRHVFLAKNAVLYESCHILCDAGTFVMGANSHLAVGVYVNAVRGEVRLGDGVAVGPYSVLLAYTNHYQPGRLNAVVRREGRVVVENDAFLGAHVVVMPGVTIGEGAVVGAGAVVTRDVPPRAMVVGVPARVVRYLEDNEPVTESTGCPAERDGARDQKGQE